MTRATKPDKNNAHQYYQLDHRVFRSDEFWKQIPAWKDVEKDEFANYLWQMKNSVTNIEQVKKVLQNRISEDLINDIIHGQKLAPMNIRITPYVFSLIDWDNPLKDPLRKQFLPLGSQFLPNHPCHKRDSLNEDVDSPVPLLTHRYPDKVLFLPLTTCPVYCSYCTRSRVVGGATSSVEKNTYGASQKKWDEVFEYLRKNPQVEDVVVSGGDSMNLAAENISYIGKNLMEIPSIRRIRYATKGIAIYPMKILTDDKWFDALKEVHQLGRSMGKQVYIHTHFSSPREITNWSKLAMEKIFAAGILVRNQAVLQNGVNNCADTMILLTRQLSYMNIQPYYVYMHDMVPGCEHFRTTLREGIELEKQVRGSTAGYNTPTFTCDLPGGGGKRHVASFEYYDEENGISVWKSPEVKPGQLFTYFDPIHRLSAEAQKRWADEKMREQMISDALKKVKA